MNRHCTSCPRVLIPAAEITKLTLPFLDMRGICLRCWITEKGISCWQHDGSGCVFLTNLTEDPEQAFAYECDELTTTQFFNRIANGWAYEILP